MDLFQSSRISYKLFFLLVIALLASGCTRSKKFSPKHYSEKSLHRFFRVIKSDGLKEAYYLTHSSFQSNTPFRILLDLDQIYSLQKNQGIEISETTVSSKNIISIEGVVNLDDSISVPFITKLSKEENSPAVNPWKIVYVEFNLRKFFESQGMVEPNSDMMLRLVKKYFLKFHSDMKRVQLRNFYNSCSSYWRSNISLNQMEVSFQPLMNSRFIEQDFRNANYSLNYQSGIRETGILVTKGNIIGSSTIEFYMEFFYELDQFRPINFNLKQL